MTRVALPKPIDQIVHAIATAGGRALIVGGWVRDHLLKIESKDLDFEVFNLELDRLEGVLKKFGRVQRVGKQFGVLRVEGLDVDFSLPRRDNKVGSGHRGFEVETDPTMSFEDAALRRDLTINSMGFDPVTGEILDPHGGKADLRDKTLRATSVKHFSEDPLRGLRAIQFAARLKMHASPQLIELCSELDLSELPKERFRTEFDKWFCRGLEPSTGLSLLFAAGLERHFPGLASLKQHSALDLGKRLDAIAQSTGLRDLERIALSLATMALFFERTSTATMTDMNPESGNRWHPSQRNTSAGAAHLHFLNHIGQPIKAQEQSMRWLHTLEWLEDEPPSEVSDGEIRRLATYLQVASIPLSHWLIGVEASTKIPKQWCEDIRTRSAQLGCLDEAQPDVVQGRDLIRRGLKPGPKFASILQACRRLQDDEGLDDADTLIDRVLLAKGQETL